jgi:polysaccharide biosynthesis/export protein
MAGGPPVAVLRDIQALFDAGTASGLSDRQLLERFVSRRDASAEAAFEALVLRHGPMVLRVCHNVLGDSTDAQDAFQATFLVLVRRCGSIRRLESLGSWLYGVACRVAARARVEAARRRAAERRAAMRLVKAVEPPEASEADRDEFGPIIQDEVRRLPEKYRAVVVLCYWKGLTHEQAADQLGCPVGTVRSRMARARSRLHRRLTRRGLAPFSGMVAAALESSSAQAARLGAVPSGLVSLTVRMSARVFAGGAIKSVASTSVAVLVQQVLRSMFMMKFRTVAVALLLCGLGAYGVGLAAQKADSAKPESRSRRAGAKKTEDWKSKAQPSLVTLRNYVVEPPDLLIVEVLEALPGRPISGERLVRPDGKISLGFYGDIFVAGLTIPEVKEKVILHLQKFLEDNALGLVDTDENGEPVLDPATKKPKLSDPRESATVFVDVTLYNSANYYVQGEVLIPGRLPVTGRETILDAINFAGGLSPGADHEGVVLHRQDSNGGLLPPMRVDIDQIMLGDDLSTNYQLKPGDRLVVPRNAKYKRDLTEAQPDPAKEGDSHQRVPSLYFNRIQTSPGSPDDHLTKAPARASGDRATLIRVEQRLNAVEHKLDEILEALRRRAR